MSELETGLDLDQYLTEITDELATRGTSSPQIKTLLRKANNGTEARRLADTAFNLRRAYELDLLGDPAASGSAADAVKVRQNQVLGPKMQAGVLVILLVAMTVTGGMWGYSALRLGKSQTQPELVRAAEAEDKALLELKQQVTKTHEELAQLRTLVSNTQEFTKTATDNIINAIARNEDTVVRELGLSPDGKTTFAKRVAFEVAGYLHRESLGEKKP